MNDYSELKRLAEAARSDNSRYGDADCYEPNFGLTVVETAFASAATPAAVLALIAENERLHYAIKHNEACFRLELGESERLRKENEALRKQIDDMSPLKGAPLTGPDLKCLACGGYHYGMSGLPCPKMTPMAQGGKDG